MSRILMRGLVVPALVVSVVQTAVAASNFTIAKFEDGALLVHVPNLDRGEQFPVEVLKDQMKNREFRVKHESLSKPTGPMRMLSKDELRQDQNIALRMLAEAADMKIGYEEIVDREYAKYSALSTRYPKRFSSKSRAEFVIDEGYQFGIEYGTWIAEGSSGTRVQGKVIAGGAALVSVLDYQVSMRDGLVHTLKRGEKIVRLEIFHNHPRRTPLSDADLEIGVMLKAADPYFASILASDLTVDVYAISLLSSDNWIAFKGSSSTDLSQLPMDGDLE